MMRGAHSLYLVRHGIAEEPGADWPSDALRPLTSQGKAKFDKVVRGLAALDVDIGIVLTSPFVRARQTAEILSRRLDGRPVVVDMTALQPGRAWRQVLPALAQYASHDGIALVGHDPSIGELAAHLLQLRGSLEFKKGTVCRIDVGTLPPQEPGRLRWLAPPRLLARLGAAPR